MSACLVPEQYVPALSNGEAFIKALLFKTEINEPFLVKILDFMMKIFVTRQKNLKMEAQNFSDFFADILAVMSLYGETFVLTDDAFGTVLLLACYLTSLESSLLGYDFILFIDRILGSLSLISYVQQSNILVLFCVLARNHSLFEDLLRRKCDSVSIIVKLLNNIENCFPLKFQVAALARITLSISNESLAENFACCLQDFQEPASFPLEKLIEIFLEKVVAFIKLQPGIIFYNTRTLQYYVYDSEHKEKRLRQLPQIIPNVPTRRKLELPLEKLEKLLQENPGAKICLVDLSNRSLLESLSPMKFTTEVTAKKLIFVYLKKHFSEVKSIFTVLHEAKKKYLMLRRVRQTLDFIEKSFMKTRRPHVLLDSFSRSNMISSLGNTGKRDKIIDFIKRDKFLGVAIELAKKLPDRNVIVWSKAPHTLLKVKKLQTLFPNITFQQKLEGEN